MGLTTGSLFFYGGVTGLVVTIIAAVAIAIMQSGDKKRLQEKLNDEYGKTGA